MAILCFGGTFNPIHYGHLICARAAAETLGFAQILLIPSSIPPHKQTGPAVAAAADRLEMCRLATQGLASFDVSDIETRRATPSFTLVTARQLQAQTHERVIWLIGSDTVPHLPNWHEPEALMEEVDFAVMHRPGAPVDWDHLPKLLHRLRENVIPAPLIDISATDIRRRAASGKAIDFLTPPAVVSYIHDRGLYRG